MQLFLLLFSSVLKFFMPVLLLRFPFQASWGNYVLDVIDGDILLYLGMEENMYQIVDKVADYWSYIFMLILGLRWQIRKTIIALFAYRTVGQALFFITRNELVFFYFQNFLEPLVMIYALLLLKQGTEEKTFLIYKKHFKLIWVIILGYKLWNEWYLHFANIDLSLFFFGFTG